MSKAARLIVGSRFGCGFCEAESLDSVVRFSFRHGARHRQNRSSAEWIVSCLAWIVLYLAMVRLRDGGIDRIAVRHSSGVLFSSTSGSGAVDSAALGLGKAPGAIVFQTSAGCCRLTRLSP